MAGSMKRSHPNGVHPEEVSLQLNVHLRTVFRWIEKRYLDPIKGTTLVDKESLAKTVSLLKSSCSTIEASDRLNAPLRTIQYFRDQGILEKVCVLGEIRITHTSLTTLIRSRRYKRRRFLSLYRPKTKQGAKLIGNRRLVTFETASRFTGISIDLLKKSNLKTFEADEETLLFAHSIRSHVRR